MKILLKLFLAIHLLVFLSLSCKKKNDTQNQLLKTKVRGIFGKVLIYDEFGDQQFSYDDIVIKGRYSKKSIDTTSIPGKSIIIYKDSLFSLKVNANGRFSLDSCPEGYYTLQFLKNQYGNNTIFKLQHSTSSADSNNIVILSKVPLATVSIDSIGLSSDNKLLQIKRTVNLTGPSSKNYSVVTRYFFSNDSSDNEKSFLYQWVSGVTNGNGGFTNTIVVNKATDKFQSSGINLKKRIYIRAYIDNFHNYGYIDSTISNKMIFPNITSPSKVVSFLMDTTKI